MLHIYHGNGKGKTTAAVGLAVRGAGAGLKVLFMQFLKNGTSSEISVLRSIGGIEVICCEECSKFTFNMTEAERDAVTARHNEMLKIAEEYISSGKAEMVIMDELLDAYNKEMLDKAYAERIAGEWSEKAEIVLTGREPAEIFIENADYISHVTAEKHPYTKGISARRGIEY